MKRKTLSVAIVGVLLSSALAAPAAWAQGAAPAPVLTAANEDTAKTDGDAARHESLPEEDFAREPVQEKLF